MGAPSWLTAAPFAHRGLHSAGRVENSPSAFAAALTAGYGIELDVQLSADGVAMVFHDDDLERLVGEAVALRALTAAELGERQLLGSNDHIPTLAAVLAAVAGRVPILIELKSKPGATGPLEQAVATAVAEYSGPFAVMSFNPESVAWFGLHHPAICRGLVASTRYRRELGWRLTNPGGQRRTVAETKPDFVAYDIRSLPNAFTEAWRADGHPLLTWTVRSAADRAKAAAHADNVIFELP